MPLPKPLQDAVEHLRSGRRVKARQLLIPYVQDHPRSDVGWYLLSFTLADQDQQRECLQRALAINPGNQKARERLLQFQPREPKEREPSAPSPIQQPIPPERRTSTVQRRRASRPSPAAAQRGMGTGLKLLLGFGGLLLLAAAAVGGYFLLDYISSTAGLQRGLAATQQSATRIARATSGAALGLPPTWTPTATPTASEMPTITPTPSHTPTATPVPPDPTTLAEMGVIEQEVADLRGLAVEGSPAAYVITSSKVRPILETSFRAGGGTQEEVDDLAHALTALGLIKPTYDLYTNILNGLTDSLGGFYLPWSGEIFVIGGRFSGVERWIYSHEYAHALVDAHFDLGSVGVYPLCEQTQDSCDAIQALVEGDATLAMTQWWQQYAGPQDVEDILTYNPPNRTLPDQFPPPYSLPDSAFPYDQGLAFVEFLYERGNWAEVNQAYQRLPDSTEQILHPEKYLTGEAPMSLPEVDLNPILGEEWRLVEDNRLGEWTTYLLLAYSADLPAQIELSEAETAAAGWGGDRYLVYVDRDGGAYVMAARWIWDTGNDASDFASALRRSQAGRYRGSQANLSRGNCWRANEETSCVLTSGREVLWLLGPSNEMLEELFSAYPEFQ
ncbi:MAG: hypothetical protein ACLFWD_12420 [Anaerolineales bacterium]